MLIAEAHEARDHVEVELGKERALVDGAAQSQLCSPVARSTLAQSGCRQAPEHALARASRHSGSWQTASIL